MKFKKESVMIFNKKISGYGFVYDGCHKFYVIGSKDSFDYLEIYDYKEEDILPMSQLPEKFYRSKCSLRFIDDINCEKTYIKQFFEPTKKVLNDIADSFEEKPKNKLLTTLDFLMLMSLFNDDLYVRKSFGNATYEETINKLKSEIK